MGRLTHWLLYMWYIDNICVRCPVIHMCIGYRPTVRSLIWFVLYEYIDCLWQIVRGGNYVGLTVCQPKIDLC